MKLVKQAKGSWQYQLNQNEADILLGLLQKFPFTELDPAKISKTDKAPEAIERGKLLNESLAEHRNELKKLAVDLAGPDKWKKSEKGHLLTLDSGAREILLQILNDIRIGCWRALGEPESLETLPGDASMKDLAYRNLMDLAGYFEMNLILSEE
jgi:hypothetical protein